MLERASSADETLILEAIGKAAAMLPAILEHGAERVKNQLNQRKAADGKEKSGPKEGPKEDR